MQWNLKECYKFVEPIIFRAKLTLTYTLGQTSILGPPEAGASGALPGKMLKVKRLESCFIAI